MNKILSVLLCVVALLALPAHAAGPSSGSVVFPDTGNSPDNPDYSQIQTANGPVSRNNPEPVTLSDMPETTFSVGASGPIPSSSAVYVGPYGSVIVHITDVGSGNTIFFQDSSDAVHWENITCDRITDQLPTTSVPATGYYFCPARIWFQLSVTSYGSGTITGGINAKGAVAGKGVMQAVFGVPSPLGATAGISPGSSSGATAKAIPKALGGALYQLRGSNFSAAGFLMTFNATTAPADGSVTGGCGITGVSGQVCECIPVASGGTQEVRMSGIVPEFYNFGIVAAFSTGSDCQTLTTNTGTANWKWAVK